MIGSPRQGSSSSVTGVPLLFRATAAARRTLGTPATRLVGRTPIATPLRRALSSRAPAGPAIVEIAGGRLRGTRLCVDLSREKYYWLGTHEPHLQDAIVRNVRPCDVVYDIGAHVGFFSMLAARCTGPAGRVIAFEPIADNISRLRAGVDANRIPNIESYCLAVSDRAGYETFALHDSSLEGLLIGDEPLPQTHESAVVVRTNTIDDLVRAGMPPPNVMKLDVEGAEGRVIAGARETIADCRPLLLIEVHSRESGAEVIGALPLPYQFEDIEAGCAASAPLASGHYLARPR